MKSTIKKTVALMILVSLTACSTMQPVEQPRAFLESRTPSVIWLSKSSDRTMVAIDAPKLVGDSIVGFVEGEYTEIPLVDVKAMQARQYSRKKTTAFLIGAGAVVVGLTFLIQGGHGANPEMDGEDDIGILRFRFP
jgi:hypothetical protein